METHYYWNKFGIPQAVAKMLISFAWTVLCIGLGYAARRLEILNTEEAIATAAALRSLVSGFFAYAQVAGPNFAPQSLQDVPPVAVAGEIA